MEYTVDQVIKVYSGRSGCACGCRGKYSYSSRFEHEAPEYHTDAVNDRAVKNMFTRLMKDPDLQWDANVAYVETPTRTKFIVFANAA